ncbi:DUF3604 domain-containing protein [Desulfosarcina sp.]|uniref:DUF3604 domain-containing protein n=1 Tax=Desulfosarcina sp. TaxID=2027861 RepID=UPI0029B0BC3B|nr:DUF3604 domain-containing protein [Desulfosarcina sp.]MDX2452722.1 DUF3604 domain-containing protein [Desulfosarcina sp.]MDX2490470.1 DUF3604 domain-containing protein [Desulfosarcina sp.]
MIFIKNINGFVLAAGLIATLMITHPVAASDAGSPTTDMLSNAYTGKVYSPYAKRGISERPLWGDSHLHTSLSMDAGLFGNRLSPREAYRFARGEEVVSSTGQAVRLSRPLDWLVVADHSDGMGMVGDLAAGKPQILAFEQGTRWSKGIEEGGDASVQAALDLISNFSQGTVDPALMALYSPGSKLYKNLWEKVIDDAEAFNDPGRFTALIGFEWTSLIKGNNMHRVVIMRDGAVRARQVVPFTMTAPQGSPDPRDLWKYMANYEKKTDGEVLAIAHNGNLSNGIMFPLEAQWNGTKLDETYVTQRSKWEPLYEATQIKGDGETHPFLSPDDEFADYETWDVANLDASVAKTNDMLAGEYAREALKRGLAIEKRLGTNPYKFGMLGATDSHTSLATAEEDNFFGKHAGYEPNPGRMSHPFMKTDKGEIVGWQMVASGLAAVWATENTREAIFDAMLRKEVYGTTGPRMSVRMFGGWEFTDGDINSRIPANVGYQKGSPMGGDLRVKPEDATAPNFMVYALRDPIGANLDRIQIVKGWLNADGTTHEKVYDVVWSGERVLDKKGKLPAVGNTVDAATASWTNTIGAAELSVVWTDPYFDAKQKAFYYARVLEIPTPRWSTYDTFRFGIDPPEGVPVSTQERAYTSPIWYTPKS